ncbi:hypothetical protein [Saccharothrix australiensis]|uniref:hypothetical protein n=1 Tax=Saccharothrix australiensis TaxID=2072 RepID=UPI000EAD5FE2|nr:hypothetical protein [Saccharothrix australiensis]
MPAPSLEPNPLGHQATPIFARAVFHTAVGSGLLVVVVTVLFGLTVPPLSLAGLGLGSTWVMLACAVAARVVRDLLANGNNLFVIAAPLGWSAVLLGVLGAGCVGLVLRSALLAHPHEGGVLEGRFRWVDAAMLAVVPVCGWLFVRAGVLFARSRRYLVRTVRSPDDLRGTAYSLYLRTFGDDDRLANPRPFAPVQRLLRGTLVTELPEEVHLVDALAGGEHPIVAVGRPGEPTPQIGAPRLHLPDDWQPPVRDLIRGARHVVLTLGWGRGALWELGEAMRLLPPERLILVVAMSRSEYGRFRDRAAVALAAHARRHPREDGADWTPPRLPAWGGAGELRSPIQALIHFGPGWAGAYEPVRRYSPVHNSLRVALMVAARPALRRLGHPPRGVFRLLPG